jgi:hypothetical protein
MATMANPMPTTPIIHPTTTPARAPAESPALAELWVGEATDVVEVEMVVKLAVERLRAMVVLDELVVLGEVVPKLLLSQWVFAY